MLPATVEPVVLKAELVGSAVVVQGQVAVANSRGIRRVELVPADVAATPGAVEAIAAADQVVYAPGSLYTSVLPVLCVDELRAAIATTAARVVQVANLRPQVPETDGLDGADHLAAVLAHGARVDTFLYDARRRPRRRPRVGSGRSASSRWRRRLPGTTASPTTRTVGEGALRALL